MIFFGFFSSREIVFLKIVCFFLIFFQVDITSSDLNEFWIGQNILKAESLLLDLSTTFMGLGGDKWSPGRKLGPHNKIIFLRRLESYAILGAEPYSGTPIVYLILKIR